MSVLVVGGVPGVGLELARKFSKNGEAVAFAGLQNPYTEGIDYRQINFSSPTCFRDVGELVDALPKLNTLVYDYRKIEPGSIRDLSLGKIREINSFCCEGLVMFLKKTLHKQEYLDELITVNRALLAKEAKLNPLYSAYTLAAEKFSKDMSITGEIGRVTVANFLLTDESSVAEHIADVRENEQYRFKYIKMYSGQLVADREHLG